LTYSSQTHTILSHKNHGTTDTVMAARSGKFYGTEKPACNHRKTQDTHSRWLWRRCACNTAPCTGWGKQHLEKMTELDVSKPQCLGNWISWIHQWCSSSCHSNKGRHKKIIRSSLTSCQASAVGAAKVNKDDRLRQ